MERYAISGNMAGPIFLYCGPSAVPERAEAILCGCGAPPADRKPLIMPVAEAREDQAVWLSSAFTGGNFELELRALCARFPAVYLSLDPLRVRFSPPSPNFEIPETLHEPCFFSEALQCFYASYLDESGRWRIELHDTAQTLAQKAELADACGVAALLYDE